MTLVNNYLLLHIDSEFVFVRNSWLTSLRTLLSYMPARTFINSPSLLPPCGHNIPSMLDAVQDDSMERPTKRDSN